MSDALLRRIERLEALETCRGIFHQYLHYLDGGLTDDLLGVFAESAELEVMNFPPGSGNDLRFSGRDGMRKLYAGMKAGTSRHHAANTCIDVAADARSADLSSYFLTTLPETLTGGVYEAHLEPVDGRWQITWMRITSSWGWRIQSEAPPMLAETLGQRTLREGRPVIFGETSAG